MEPVPEHPNVTMIIAHYIHCFKVKNINDTVLRKKTLFHIKFQQSILFFCFFKKMKNLYVMADINKLKI